MQGEPPDFAVVVVAADDDNLRAMLPRLRAQTLHERLEIVVVAREGTVLTLGPTERAGFQGVRLVTCPPQASLPAGLALGTRHATAPFVALIEDHCFPDPGWAEALLARHRQGHTVVGPEIRNANPGSPISACSFLMTHGGWAEPAATGLVDTVAGDNSSYRRDAILAIGGELETLLASGTILHWQLREAGHSVFLEAGAKAAHLTPSRLASFLGSRFHNGRAFAGLWSRRWPWSKRLRFAALAPWMAVRRALWVAGLARRRGQALLPLVPLLLLAIVASAAGYFLGFVLGAGASVLYSSDLYFRRDDHLEAGDRASVLAAQKPKAG